MAGANADESVVAGFGDEWSRFDQSGLTEEDLQTGFDSYFGIFPWAELADGAVGMDVGCGSGRWARLVAPRVGRLVCVDASSAAVRVAEANLQSQDNVEVRHASVDALPVEDESLDFAYSLGVLHHVPDTASGIASVARKLKPGAPLLLYLYYNFENRPPAYRWLWSASEVLRRSISRAPHRQRYLASQVLAGAVYWPLARAARVGEALGLNVEGWPLAWYRSKGFYVLRTDALDRFGTRLEQRFSRQDITKMALEAGLTEPEFSERPPFWVCVARRA